MHVLRKIGYISIVLIGGLALFILGRYSALRQTTTCGLTLSVATEQRVYTLGDPIRLLLTYRNCTPHAVEFWSYVDSAEMRMVLMDGVGRSVEKTAQYRKAEQHVWSGGLMFNRPVRVLPGGAYKKSIDLNDWFVITTPGVYHLVICQSNNIRWKDNISVSNPVLIRITAPKNL